MKARNIPIITGLICASIMMEMINLSFANDNDLAVSRAGSYSNPGYKPVLDECPDIEVGAYCNTPVPFDNTLYKEWCERTFKHGNHIYEAYKDIAFNIKYTPESAKTDFWQTPFETTKSKSGDCEDAVFLFFSHLLPNQENAEIVWGWVIDRRIGVAKAHVWYQLKDKEGQLYVVEGFSNDWNGIIPMEIIKQTESRKPIFTLSHSEASRLASIISKPDSWETYQLFADLHGSTDFTTPEPDDKNVPERRYTRRHLNSGFIEHQSMSRTYNTSWGFSVSNRMAAVMCKEISKIFKKLHVLFTRYERQKEDYTSSSQVAYNYIHSKKTLNCKR
jgi:hypothetical protein